MNLVTVINGVSVYSDKKVNSVVNNTVYFTDGSYANVATETIVNKGRGGISLGTPTEQEKKVTREETYPAQNETLVLENLSNVEVVVHSRPEIKIILTGPGSLVDKMEITNKSGKIKVVGPRVSGGSISQVISVGDINISSSLSNSGQISAQISVPQGTPLKIDDCKNITVGDIFAPLILHSSGVDQISIGKITDLTLTSSGSCRAIVREIQAKTVDITISGSGYVGITAGTAATFSSRISGSGRIDAHLVVTNADLTISGSGTVSIDSVTGDLEKTISGSGRVNVNHLPIPLSSVHSSPTNPKTTRVPEPQGEINLQKVQTSLLAKATSIKTAAIKKNTMDLIPKFLVEAKNQGLFKPEMVSIQWLGKMIRLFAELNSQYGGVLGKIIVRFATKAAISFEEKGIYPDWEAFGFSDELLQLAKNGQLTKEKLLMEQPEVIMANFKL